MRLDRTLDFCIASACAVLCVHRDKIKTFYTLFKMASHVKHEIEETQPNRQGTGRGKGKKWSDSATDNLIDLLEKHFCLWDVSKKEYHLRNLRERAYEEMRDELDIEIADIKTKIMNLRNNTLTYIHWIANVKCLYNTFAHRYYRTLYIIIHCRLYMYSACIVRLHKA